jgi:hypothetical protein
MKDKNLIVNHFRLSPIRQMSSMSFARPHNDLLLWLESDEEDMKRCSIEYFDIDKYLPLYQRDGDKWTIDMKRKFIFNILKGYKTNIILATNPSRNDKYIILDGQQRLKAIKEFLTDKFDISILGKNYFYSQIKEEIKKVNVCIGYYTLRLNSEIEEVELYIDMNENITHSTYDIDIAKKYLEKLINKGDKDESQY